MLSEFCNFINKQLFKLLFNNAKIVFQNQKSTKQISKSNIQKYVIFSHEIFNYIYIAKYYYFFLLAQYDCKTYALATDSNILFFVVLCYNKLGYLLENPMFFKKNSVY